MRLETRFSRNSMFQWWIVASILGTWLSAAEMGAGGPTNQEVIPYDEGMEGEIVRGGGGCTGAGCQFWRRVNTQAYGGSFSMFAIDFATAGSSTWGADQVFAIPADATTASLTFWHRFIFEANGEFTYDGGVVELSVDNGSNWVDAGAHITSAAYNGTILLNPARGNPLGGRPGWVGRNDDWQQVVIDLMPYRAQSVIFRLRLGTDDSNSSTAEGWWVDDVQVSYRAPLASCDRGWSSASSYPTSTHSLALVGMDGTLYAFGGSTNDAATASAFKYSVDSDTWTPIAALPEPRIGASAVTDGASIYILGGGRGQAGATTLWSYSPGSNNYSTLAPSSIGTGYHASVYLDGKIYRIAGRTDLSDFTSLTSTVEIYDVAANSWNTGSSYPEQRGSVAAIAVDGYVYAAGGTGDGFSQPTLKTYRYDPTAESWDDGPIADLPQGGAAHGALYGDQWVLFSGAVPYSWHRQTNSWRSVDQVPERRSGAAVAATGGFVHVISPGTMQQYFEIPCTSGCLGDCGNDGSVSISDLIRGVAIALMQQPLSACSSFDDNGDGRVAVNELVAAVGNALRGCAPL